MATKPAVHKILKEDEKHFLIQHPDGSKFRIAKAALSPETVSKIQHFADGGEVENPVDNSVSVDPSGQLTAAPGSNILSPQAYEAAGDQMTPPPGAPPSPATVSPVETTPTPVAEKPIYGPNPPTLDDQVNQAKTANDKAAQGLLGSFGAEEKHIKQLGDVQSQGLKEQASGKDMLAGAMNQAALDAQKRHSEQAKTIQDTQSKIQQQQDTFNKMNVDPNKWWNDKGTAGKITGALAVALGAIGASVGKTPNFALQIIQDAINKDVEAQKYNISKTGESLNQQRQALNQQLSVWDSEDNKKLSDQMMGWNAVQKQLESTALKNEALQKSPQAAILADGIAQKKAALGQQITQNNLNQKIMQQQMEHQRNIMGALQGGQVPVGTNLTGVVDPKEQAKLVNVNGNYRMAQTPEAATEYRKSQIALDEVQKNLASVRQFQDEHKGITGAGFGGKTSTLASGMRSKLVTSLNKLAALNRLTENEVEQFQKRIPNVAGLTTFDSTIYSQLDSLQNDINDAAQGNMEALLVGGAPKRPRTK